MYKRKLKERGGKLVKKSWRKIRERGRNRRILKEWEQEKKEFLEGFWVGNWRRLRD